MIQEKSVADAPAAHTPYTPAVAPTRRRIDSVDLLRGVIMILMALDHTRDYFGAASVNPTDLATTTPALFFTRWITHFCAPVFFLLTGTGAYLARRRRTTSDLSFYLITRGFWLIVLEVVIMRFIWQFNVDYRVTMLTVLWALGWSMVVLGGLVFLPTWAVAGFGVLLITLHNLTDGVNPQTLGALGPLWTILHRPGFVFNGATHSVFVAYPLVPWIGVTAVGYALGSLYKLGIPERKALLLRIGLSLIALFIVLRAMNVYGDPAPWSAQRSFGYTVLSFINTTKYPPSLLFLLMTLGPALLFLRAVDGSVPRPLGPALIIGRVPMFYYLMHVVFIHAFAVIGSLVRFGAAHWMFESPTVGQFPVTQPPGWPAPLPVVYLVWVMVVVLLYPCCRWYAAIKARSNNPLLSYL
ncbi:MAG TPA: heparan-alpha-glucosaminide N-acetyltransferase domain-containing protein [Gemmatimonadaceae bacterium]|jgi:uncharacterized membrane protein|nr:heparan-alpha-glucosaminide N-acetyltransferase domain-containing protein [Gemmatimonadaceae bacterium]